MPIADQNKRRMTAIAVTVLVHAAIVAVLLSIFLKFDSTAEQPEWPPVDSAEILFGGEMVNFGDVDQPDIDVAAEPQAPEATSTEVSAPETPTTPAPPAKVTTKPTATQTQASSDKEEAQRKAKSEEIASRVFGSGQGHSGSPNGNTDSGGVGSGVAASGFGNRKAEHLPKPNKGPMGQVVIRIKVDHDGTVKEASYLKGTGAAAASSATRENCLAAARKARFSKTTTGPALQTGTLTYTFK
ncbi:MAG: TonB family protein [Muribaculaceae bacterium]|nr:TonB family protein [Muribaculaceae bacterium]